MRTWDLLLQAILAKFQKGVRPAYFPEQAALLDSLAKYATPNSPNPHYLGMVGDYLKDPALRARYAPKTMAMPLYANRTPERFKPEDVYGWFNPWSESISLNPSMKYYGPADTSGVGGTLLHELEHARVHNLFRDDPILRRALLRTMEPYANKMGDSLGSIYMQGARRRK